MPVERIENLPAGTRLFLDANIFVYAFLGHSNECQGLLGRCATEQVLGITTLVRHGLLTNDSLIVAAMEEFGIDSLATRDNDFDHISELIVYKPSDI